MEAKTVVALYQRLVNALLFQWNGSIEINFYNSEQVQWYPHAYSHPELDSGRL